jgi:RNA polymerase sigma factor (TIGR02999 family)
MSGEGEVTRLPVDWSAGDHAALDRLLPLVYDELRRLAKSHMRRERPDGVLQTTALVHEAYLRLVDQKNVRWQTRAHFFAVAAQVMRHILIDYARGRQRAKRGGGVRASRATENRSRCTKNWRRPTRRAARRGAAWRCCKSASATWRRFATT